MCGRIDGNEKMDKTKRYTTQFQNQNNFHGIDLEKRYV